MRRSFICVAALLMAGLCGCSRNQTLAHRLNEADRVLVLRPDNGVTMTLTGEQLRKLVQAVESAKKIKTEGLCASPGYTLVFYKSSVHLATLPTAADLVFFINDAAYHDESGTLRKVGETFRMKHPY